MYEILNYTNNYTLKQLVLPLDIQTIIPFDDPIYTFDEVMKGCNLQKYLINDNKDSRGRIGYNSVTLLEVILFAFMEKGYSSLRELERLCNTDIRFMYLLRNEKTKPTHMTFSNFINNYLKCSIEDIFYDINQYIFEKDNVNLDVVYIDGSKFEANANKYSWIWKKACTTSREKLYRKITTLLDEVNNTFLNYEMTNYTIREAYEIDYLESIFYDFMNRFNIDTSTFVHGKGKRKSNTQRFYEKLERYLNKLKEYADHIEICGDKRNSYSKTDNSATFMRVKRDYMGNDQLIPAYNVQLGVSDEYISVCDVFQCAADSDCFKPLLESFKAHYYKYPKYPVGDAGYGNYNNYLYCKENEMELYQKFSMYKKITEDKKYINNPFKTFNFKQNENRQLVCPNNKAFLFLKTRPVRLRVLLLDMLKFLHFSITSILTSLYKKCTTNCNLSKYDRWYKRIVRRGMDSVRLEIFLVSIGYNLYKFHNKKNRIIQ